VPSPFSALHITSRSRFGLSNRIRGLAGYHALSRVLCCDLRYSWEPDPSCPGWLQEVFEAIPAGWPLERLTSDPEVLVIGTATTPEMPTHCGSEPDKTFFCHAHGRVEKADFDGHVREFYRQLRPAGAEVERVAAFRRAELPEGAPTFVIHLRRTDMVDLRERLGLKPLRMEGILEGAGVFLREQPYRRVLLACGNPDSLALVKTRLGDRVHHLEHDWILENLADNEDTSIQARLTSLYDAICDLWMLSQCDRILGTTRSSFSVFAGLWGRKPVVAH
jgi:hypothetical protein